MVATSEELHDIADVIWHDNEGTFDKSDYICLHELASEVEALEKDNARLCEALDELQADPVNEVLCRTQRENDKLRKLVLDMRKAFFTLDIDHCQACPRDTINGPCTKYTVGGSDECDFDRCMRELGIEVDGELRQAGWRTRGASTRPTRAKRH